MKVDLDLRPKRRTDLDKDLILESLLEEDTTERRQDLAQAYLQVVWATIRKVLRSREWQRRRLQADVLVSYGYEGLMKALDRWLASYREDILKGSRQTRTFGGLAKKVIRDEVCIGIRTEAGLSNRRVGGKEQWIAPSFATDPHPHRNPRGNHNKPKEGAPSVLEVGSRNKEKGFDRRMAQTAWDAVVRRINDGSKADYDRKTARAAWDAAVRTITDSRTQLFVLILLMLSQHGPLFSGAGDELDVTSEQREHVLRWLQELYAPYVSRDEEERMIEHPDALLCVTLDFFTEPIDEDPVEVLVRLQEGLGYCLALIDDDDVRWKPSLLGQLLGAFENRPDRLFSDELVDYFGLNNAKQLSLRLEPFGIKSRKVRRGGRVARGYVRKDVEDVWARIGGRAGRRLLTITSPAAWEVYRGLMAAWSEPPPSRPVTQPPERASDQARSRSILAATDVLV